MEQIIIAPEELQLMLCVIAGLKVEEYSDDDIRALIYKFRAVMGKDTNIRVLGQAH